MLQWPKYILIAGFVAITFSACAQNDDNVPAPTEATNLKAGKILSCYVRATHPVNYGGGGYCDYSTVFSDVRMWIQFSEDGNAIISATVVFLSREFPASTCTLKGFPPTNHYYRLMKPVLLQNGATIPELQLAGTSGNRPVCEMFFSGKISNGAVTGKIRIHRTDQAPPLDYALDIPVVLD